MHGLDKELVVAKYKEDLGWLHRVTWLTTIYDKHPDKRLHLPYVRYIDLENSIYGREAHTYLHHIVSRYENLANLTYFVQGRPFDHYPFFYQTLDSKYKYKDIVGFSWYKGNPDCPNDSWFPSNYEDLELYMGTRAVNDWMDNRWKITFPGEYMPKFAVFSSGAQIVVPKWRILQRPKSFYERLLFEVQKEPCILDAWFFEIVWLYIFGGTDPKLYSPRLNGKTYPLWL